MFVCVCVCGVGNSCMGISVFMCVETQNWLKVQAPPETDESKLGKACLADQD